MRDCKYESLVGYLTDKRQFTIPNWQRGYEWPSETAVSFIDDIVRSNEERPYFGDMIVYENDGNDGVVLADAQQRATTIMIASYCLWSHLDNANKASKKFRRMFVAESDIDGESDPPKIVLKTEDENEIISDILEINPAKRAETQVDIASKYWGKGTQLYKNYVEIKKKINGLINEGYSVDEIREKMAKARVCIKYSESEEEAMRAFRKVNAEGEKVSDFRAAAEYIGEGEDPDNTFLRKIQTELTDKEGRNLFAAFIFYEGAGSKDVPYEENKFLKKLKKIESPLLKMTSFYNNWYEPLINTNKHGKYSYAARKVFDNPYAMKYSIMRQAVISLFSDMFNDVWETRGISFEDRVRLYKAIWWGHIVNTVNFAGAQSAKLFNFVLLFESLKNGEKNVNGLIEEFLRPRGHGLCAIDICNDEIKRLRDFDMMLLYECERYLERDIVEDGVIIEHPTLEHIYPQRAKESDRDSDTEAMKFMLGNMTILTSSKNKSLKNSPYAEKNEVYERSVYRLNDNVKNRGKWTSVEIAERNEFLADVLSKIFGVRKN